MREINLTYQPEKNLFFSKSDVEKVYKSQKIVLGYFTFGMLEPGRNTNPTESRYAFQSMETDASLSGTGNSYTTYFRQYDPRLGRWKTPDPVIHAWESPYNAFDANPIYFADPSGADGDPPANNSSGGHSNKTRGSNAQTKTAFTATNNNIPEIVAKDNSTQPISRGLNSNSYTKNTDINREERPPFYTMNDLRDDINQIPQNIEDFAVDIYNTIRDWDENMGGLTVKGDVGNLKAPPGNPSVHFQLGLLKVLLNIYKPVNKTVDQIESIVKLYIENQPQIQTPNEKETKEVITKLYWHFRNDPSGKNINLVDSNFKSNTSTINFFLIHSPERANNLDFDSLTQKIIYK